MTDVRDEVVQGGSVDGSAWPGVYDLLTAEGGDACAVQAVAGPIAPAAQPLRETAGVLI